METKEVSKKELVKVLIENGETKKEANFQMKISKALDSFIIINNIRYKIAQSGKA